MDQHERHARWLIGEMQTGRMSRREFLGRSTALGAALGLGMGVFQQALAATPTRGGHMRLAMGHGSTTDTLDPATLTNGLQWVVAYGVANTLTELDAQGNLVGSLATEWEASPDATVWTFRLRQGVEFHNGKTLTAEDVIASINYHRGEASKSVGKPVMDPITEIRADGPDKVVFTLSAGNADFPFNFNEATFGIYPAKDDGIDWKAGGSGGYILKNEQPGQFYEFERNPNYWKDGAAHADTVALQSITDPAARQNALITGEVDCIDRVELKTLALMARRPGVIIEEGTGPLHYTFPMAIKVAPFDNLELRKALKFAINREEIVAKILFGHGVVGNDHPIGPSYRYHADIEQNTYDPDRARHHMQKSGLGDITIDLSASDAAYSGALDAAVLYPGLGQGGRDQYQRRARAERRVLVGRLDEEAVVRQLLGRLRDRGHDVHDRLRRRGRVERHAVGPRALQRVAGPGPGRAGRRAAGRDVPRDAGHPARRGRKHRSHVRQRGPRPQREDRPWRAFVGARLRRPAHHGALVDGLIAG